MYGQICVFTPKQERFLQALLTSETKTEAIAQAGIGETTAYKLLKDVDFSAEYRRRQTELVTCALQEAQKLAKDAVRIIHEVALDVETPPAAKVSAAKAILDYAIKGVELDRANKENPVRKTWVDLVREMESVVIPNDEE